MRKRFRTLLKPHSKILKNSLGPFALAVLGLFALARILITQYNIFNDTY